MSLVLVVVNMVKLASLSHRTKGVRKLELQAGLYVVTSFPLIQHLREDSSELHMAYTNSYIKQDMGKICSLPVSRSFALQPEEVAVLPLHRGDMTLPMKLQAIAPKR